jgi:hypothetical protein
MSRGHQNTRPRWATTTTTARHDMVMVMATTPPTAR